MITELDHLMIGVPDLEEGIEWWASLTGVRPVHGGPHEGLGTHNALAALGDTLYLELLAPDPSQSARSPIRETLSQLEAPRPSGWCYACDDAAKTHRELAERGVESAHAHFARDKPGGETVKWELVFPSHQLGPVIPFLIDWGNTTRPVEDSPQGCSLLDVTPFHPQPAEPQALLDKLGIEATVAPGPRSGLRFRFDSPAGEVCVEP